MWSTDDIPALDGTVAVVTGANSGLGKASAMALAGAGAHVVMAARNQDKARAAHAEILSTHPGASLEIVELDLGSLASVQHAADQVSRTHDRIDVLMNNAGLMAMPQRQTEDGFEMQWGVNVLGHWALTSHLLPLVLQTPGARVVSLASVAQHQSRGIAPDPHRRGSYDPWSVYSQSKLGDRVFAMGLQQQFEQAGVEAMSFVAHPGLTNSDLQQRTHREQGGVQARFWATITPVIGMTIEQGALSQLRAATEPGADPHKQYCPLFGAFGPPVAKPMVRPGTDRDIARLWQSATHDTGLEIDVAAALRAT
ncbi:MAG: SDR family NAD(P)-dependent oxidoreductase [Xanthomonadales bacterium]|nr:SDR family NAD(P)-dependent oxidoreductase [Xanthomonadales bacterium]